jgi:AraC family transcriptional regulator, transcriptional activator of pobA
MAETPKAASVPVFQLYGEPSPEDDLSTLHVESLYTRSKLHNWEIRPHRHAGLHQIFFVEGGAGEVVIDERVHAFAGPCLIAIPPLLVHGFRFTDHSEGHVVTASEGLVRRLATMFEDLDLARLLDTPLVFALAADPAPLSRAFEALGQEFREPGLGRASALTARLGLVLIEIARSGAALSGGAEVAPQFALLQAFRSLVEQYFAAQWSVGDYAGALAVTKARLTAVSQRLTGRSPLQLVHDRVLLEAKRNLIHTSMSVGEISYALGFREPAYFCRFFTQKAGCPPTVFRRQSDQQRSAA